jgi:hypothetical protein
MGGSERGRRIQHRPAALSCHPSNWGPQPVAPYTDHPLINSSRGSCRGDPRSRPRALERRKQIEPAGKPLRDLIREGLAYGHGRLRNQVDEQALPAIARGGMG